MPQSIKFWIICVTVLQLGLIQVRSKNAEGAEQFTVGTDTPLLFIRVRRQNPGLFMNLGAPSQGEGVVTSWHYCYSCPSAEEYRVLFMVYRLDSGNQQYEMLPRSTINISVVCEQRNAIQCEERTLFTNEQFPVQSGDVVAICLPDDGREPIQITSTIRNGGQVRRISAHQFSDNRGEVCAIERLQTILSQDLTQQKRLLLHLYSDVVSGISTTQATGSTVTVPTTTTTLINDDGTENNIEPLNGTTSPLNTTENITLQDSNATIIPVSPNTRSLTTLALSNNIITLPPLYPAKSVIIYCIFGLGILLIIVIIVAIVVVIVGKLVRRKKKLRRTIKSSDANDTNDEHYYCYANTGDYEMNVNVSYNCNSQNTLFPSHYYEYLDDAPSRNVNNNIIEEGNIYDTIDTL